MENSTKNYEQKSKSIIVSLIRKAKQSHKRLARQICEATMDKPILPTQDQNGIIYTGPIRIAALYTNALLVTLVSIAGIASKFIFRQRRCNHTYSIYGH